MICELIVDEATYNYIFYLFVHFLIGFFKNSINMQTDNM